MRPALIVEVTSPETRSIDLTTRLEEYDLAGVPLYIIIDLVQRQGRIVPRLLGYRQTPSVYAVVAPDDRGWLWLEPLKVWLGIHEQSIVCYDAAGAPIGDYADLRMALDTEAAARATAEQRVKELEAELRRLRGEGKRSCCRSSVVGSQ